MEEGAVLDFLPSTAEPRSVLSVGSGPQQLKEWEANGYVVVRTDIDPAIRPDLVADMRNLGNIGLFDVVFCCHALEHLYPHEVGHALHEFRRVLRKDGTVIILVPDLEGVAPTEDVLFSVGHDQFTGLHLYYGDPMEIPKNPYMAHHCGFVQTGLQRCLEACGFSDVVTKRLPNYNLMGIGVKRLERTSGDIRDPRSQQAQESSDVYAGGGLESQGDHGKTASEDHRIDRKRRTAARGKGLGARRHPNPR